MNRPLVALTLAAAAQPALAAIEITDLDWAALQDIGWQVTPVPEPHTWATMLAGLGLVLAACMRCRRQAPDAAADPARGEAARGASA